MAINESDEIISQQLIVSNGPVKTIALGKGDDKITGATYMRGPTQIGKADNFSKADAALMVGPTDNYDAPAAWQYAVHVKDTIKHEGDKIHDGNLIGSNLKGCTGQNCDFTNSTINQQSWKGFDISHPSQEGYRLRYVCLEGPEGGVYVRGRVKNKTEIHLPDYWKDLVNIQSITVSLTPVGAHQDVIVKRWDESKIYLQAKGGMPVDCFYHIFAERKDGEKLIVEYQGQSPADYPGDSSQFSIAGYDYGAGRS